MTFPKTLLACGMLLATQSFGQAQHVLAPQIAELLQTPLKQTKITDCGTAIREVQWGTTRISYTPEGLQLDGQQASGAAWQAKLPASNVLKCEVWSATLQKGEKPSLLVFKAPESGLIEGGELTILSFDAQNKPLPWKATGAFTSTTQGITQISSDATTGSAQVLVSVKEGDPHADTAEVTSLFQRTNNSFAKMIGTDKKGAKWPLIAGSEKALTGKEQLLTSTLSQTDVGTVSRMAASTTEAKIVKRADFSEDEPVVFSNGQRSKFPAMFVLDKADGSRLIFTDENVVDGVDEAIRLGANVTLQGTACESDECRPFLMMARAGAV